MVNTSLVTHFDWAPFRRHTVGFDNVFSLMDKFLDDSNTGLPNYPPYNIYKSEDGSKYSIELAVAGFTEKDVEVKYANNTLSIVGNKEEKESDSFLHRGIATRSFNRTFNIADDVVIREGSLKNGILSINLERVIPEEKKERIIKIAS
jgi:molecular chaperone IbpA|tara:strand:- start:1732 stop:2175 length:444 start_codon:yes stop_codon:yes gene_type:complete